MTPSPFSRLASGAVSGLLSGLAQTIAGIKTFTSVIIASAGVQTASVFSTNGAGAGDVVLKVGTTQADASVNDAATLWSLVTGLGTGSEVQRFSLTKTRAKVVAEAGTTFANPVVWFDTSAGIRQNIIQFGSGLTSLSWEFALGLFSGPYAQMSARSGMYLSMPFFNPLTPNATDLGSAVNHYKSIFLGGTTQLGIAGTAQPPANATNRGTLWYSRSAGGAADTVEMCMKSAADTYSWVVIATA
jgi:hypothetical protein